MIVTATPLTIALAQARRGTGKVTLTVTNLNADAAPGANAEAIKLEDLTLPQTMQFIQELVRVAEVLVRVAMDEAIANATPPEHPADCSCRHCEPEPVDAEERFIHED